MAAGLCYTSGTTGEPKGVLYSHRSTFLHAMAGCAVDGGGMGEKEVVLSVVPMFHVNAWGLPYSCTMAGAKQVLPGPMMIGKPIAELIESVTGHFRGRRPHDLGVALPVFEGREDQEVRPVEPDRRSSSAARPLRGPWLRVLRRTLACQSCTRGA